MEIPKPLLKIALSLAMKNLGHFAAMPMESIPHVEVIAKAYTEGQPLEVILGLYFQATGTVEDDQIAGKVAEALTFIQVEVPKIIARFSNEPFKDVLADLLKDITIPDMDDDNTNNVKIVDVINDIFKELA